MAEALREVADPLAAALDPGAEQPPGMVVAAMAAALLPAEAEAGAPAWLREDQPLAFRRVLAALQRHGGALLADPVGSGKTWIALGVAAAIGPPVVALVPATLRDQWAAAAARAGVELILHSHERTSRGVLPRVRPRLVVIDESHRFRGPATRRYLTVAPWLVGARVLLLSATPLVNRLDDLLHQLLLAVPDDTLLPSGCASLRAAVAAGVAPPALGELVLCRAAPAGLPALLRHRYVARCTPADRALFARLDGLRLSRHPGIAALIRMSLLSALGSSPRAFTRALERYRSLLAQATDAAAAGRRLTRRALREAAGVDEAQLVLWSLLPDDEAALEVAVDDAAPLRDLLAQARAREHEADPRLEQLRGLLADRAPTVVFTVSVATLEWLRERLATLQPAWLAGHGAGIGAARASRARVLALFRPGATEFGDTAPWLLLATDVAAEGLDLPRACRVVHYDLPWTATRLTQRAGRARRLASPHRAVTVVSLLPPPELERRQRRVARLLARHRLPARAGLEPRSPWLYRWRADLAAIAAGPRAGGVAAVRGEAAGWLVAFTLGNTEGARCREPARLVWIGDDSGWSEAPAEVVPRLLRAGEAEPCPLTPADRLAFPAAVAPVLRAALAALTVERWRMRGRPREQRRLVRRLLRLAAWSARRRDTAALSVVERGLAWLEGGLRAGELLRAAELVTLPRAALLSALAAGGRREPWLGPGLPRIAGIVRVTTFPAWPHSAPCCSTSTARSSIRSS